MNRLAKTERVRDLLSFDRTFLHSAQQESSHTPHGQIALAFAGAESARANPLANVRLVGFDEAGRGSLAGPVTVACVHFNWNDVCSPGGEFRDAILEAYADLNDSKQVTPRRRAYLYERILAESHYGIGFASAVEIDQSGIVAACCLAATRAYRRLGCASGSLSGYGLEGNGHSEISTDIGLFDRGLSLGDEETKTAFASSVQITKGDAKSFHIAAASILAKVRRDQIMCDLATRAEAYGFAGHKGYGSAAHIAAIRQYGPSKFHRRTFLSRV